MATTFYYPNINTGWVEKAAQKNSQSVIYSLCEFNGSIYAGTGGGGRLFKWDGTAWQEIAGQLNGQLGIFGLVSFNGKLYGGTYSQSPSEGKLFESDGASGWVEKADTLNSQEIRSLIIYNNELYAGTYPGGRLHKWDGLSAWTEAAAQFDGATAIISLCVYDGQLYGATNNGKLFRFTGSAWERVANQIEGQTEIRSLCVHEGQLYGGTAPNGKLFRFTGSGWERVAVQLGAETYIYSLASYNGRLYGGTYPTGKLYEWDGVSAWFEAAGQLGGQTVIRSLLPFNNRLYGGTQNNGRLFEFYRLKIDALEGFPSERPVERYQIRDETPGGSVIQYDLGVTVKYLDLSIKALTAVDFARLQTFIESICVWSTNSFDIVDGQGRQYSNCRWWFDKHNLPQQNHSLYGGDLLIRSGS